MLLHASLGFEISTASIMKHAIAFLALTIFTATSCSRSSESETDPTSFSNDFPHMKIALLEGDVINARELSGQMVLVLFQPDCDHCQREAAQIREHLEAFREYNLYFVSTSPAEQVAMFARDYDLNGKKNVRFGLTTVEEILDNFGAIQAPSMYIYSEKGELVRGLNGEVDISEILKYL